MKLSKTLFIFSFIFFILFSSANLSFAADTKDWNELASVDNGIQFIDKSSIKYKKGIFSALIKHSDVNPETQETSTTTIYKIEIDCDKRIFKEQGKKWAEPQNRLEKMTIINSCRY